MSATALSPKLAELAALLALYGQADAAAATDREAWIARGYLARAIRWKAEAHLQALDDPGSRALLAAFRLTP